MPQKKGKVNKTEELPEVGQTYRVFDMGRWKEAKICCVCKREFTWRKKWERCWNTITTCSDKCKTERKQKTEDQA